jgi:hypothetical protein
MNVNLAMFVTRQKKERPDKNYWQQKAITE